MSFWSFTAPLLAILIGAIVIGVAAHLAYRRSDQAFIADHRTEWEQELERRRAMRARAEQRVGAPMLPSETIEQYQARILHARGKGAG